MQATSSAMDRIISIALQAARGLIRDSRSEKPATRNEIPRTTVSTEFPGNSKAWAARNIEIEMASNTHFRIREECPWRSLDLKVHRCLCTSTGSSLIEKVLSKRLSNPVSVAKSLGGKNFGGAMIVSNDDVALLPWLADNFGCRTGAL